ncbi:MAG TPA: PAS domain S-box protein [Thermoplasmatales archaeon]|nr:PAS domain S-box protein [Thermoplasmatales archaeon]
MSPEKKPTADDVKRALEQSDEQYRVIAEQSREGIFLARKYRIVYANPALLAMLGAESSEQVRDVHVLDFLSEEDAQTIQKDVERALHGQISEKRYEVTVTRLDGRKIVVGLSLAKVTFDGKPHALGMVSDLTRIKEMEQHLRESEARYRTLIENLMDGVYIITSEGFEYVNPAFESITGYGAEEVCSPHFNFWDIIHPDDQALIHEREEARRRGEELPSAYQFRIITKQGELRYVEVNTVPLAREGIRVLGMMRDITERRKTVNKLLAGERKYRTLFESANDAIFLMAEAVFIDCNQKTLEMFGVRKEDIIGRPPYEFSPERQPDGRDSKQKALGYIQRVLQGEPQRFYWQHLRQDGTPFDTEVSLKKIELEGSVFIQAMVRDITQQKKAEESLRVAEENYRGIFENAVMGIYKSTPEGCHLSANPALARIYGYDSPADLITNMRDIAHQLYVEPRRRYELLRQLEENDQVSNFESRVYRKDGCIIWISENARTVRDDNGHILYFVGTVEDITERKEAELQLKRFSAVVETTFDGVAITDVQGNVIDVNEALVRMFRGRGKEDFIGKNIFDFIRAEHHEVQEVMAAVTEQGNVALDEITVQAVDGTRFFVEISASVMTDEEGRPTGFVGILRDVTHRKKAEEALKASEERYRTLVNHANDWIWTLDREGRFTYVNPVAEEESGYSYKDWQNRSFEPVIVPENLPAVQQAFARALEGESTTYRARIYDRHGNVLTLEVNTAPIRKDHHIVGTVSFGRNVTERQRVEEQYRILFENTGTAMVVINADTTVAEVNSQFERMLGYAGEEVVGKPWTPLVHPEDVERLREYHQRRRQDPEGTPKRYEFRALDKQGRVRYLLTNVEMLPGTQRSVVSLIDITDREQAKQALKQSEEKLRNFFETSEVGIWCFRLPQPLDLSLDEKVLLERAFESILVECNECYAAMMGATREQMLGARLADLLPDDEENRRYLLSFFRNGLRLSGGVSREVTASGEEKYFSNSMVGTVRDGCLVEVWGTQMDVTDLKLMEEALLKSEKQFRSLIENANDAIYLITPQGFEYVNPAFEELVGYGEEEIFSDEFDFRSLIHEDDQRLIREREKARQRGEEIPSRYEFRITDKSGAVKTVEVTTVNVGDAGETRVMGILRDITDRITMEEALKESEEKFKLLAESSTSAIFIYQDDVFKYINPALESISGYSRQELMSMSIWDMVHPQDREMVKERGTWRQQGERVEPARYEFRVITRDGTVKWIDFAATSIVYRGRPAALGNAYDITERKKAEEEMERALEQERDFKLRAAHHFFNPIAIAKGYLDLTLEELTEQQQQKIEAARRAICRVEKVVKNVTQNGEIHE